MPNILYKIPRYISTIFILVIVCSLSLMPDNDVNRHITLFKGADKIIHFCMYLALCFVFCFDYYRSNNIKHQILILCVAALSAITIGGVIEILQNVMQMGRHGDWLDFIVNTAGVITGICIGKKIFGHRNQID